MDLIDRYLNAVAAQLPQEERADITAELPWLCDSSRSII